MNENKYIKQLELDNIELLSKIKAKDKLIELMEIDKRVRIEQAEQKTQEVQDRLNTVASQIQSIASYMKANQTAMDYDRIIEAKEFTMQDIMNEYEQGKLFEQMTDTCIIDYATSLTQDYKL